MDSRQIPNRNSDPPHRLSKSPFKLYHPCVNQISLLLCLTSTVDMWHMARSNTMLDFEYNFEWCSYIVPALHIAPQACLKGQYEVEEQLDASHTPRSGFETHPCHL